MFDRKTKLKIQQSRKSHRPHLPLTLLALLVIHEIAHAGEPNVMMMPEMAIQPGDYIDPSLSDFQHPIDANVAFEEIEVQMSVQARDPEISTSDSDDFNADAEPSDDMFFVNAENQDTPMDEPVAEQASQEEDVQVSESASAGGGSGAAAAGGGSFSSKGLLLGLGALVGGAGLAMGGGGGGGGGSGSAAAPTPSPFSIFSIDPTSGTGMIKGGSDLLILDRTGDISQATTVDATFTLGDNASGTTSPGDLTIFLANGTAVPLIQDTDPQKSNIYHAFVTFAVGDDTETLTINAISNILQDQTFTITLNTVNPIDQVDPNHDVIQQEILAAPKYPQATAMSLVGASYAQISITLKGEDLNAHGIITEFQLITRPDSVSQGQLYLDAAETQPIMATTVIAAVNNQATLYFHPVSGLSTQTPVTFYYLATDNYGLDSPHTGVNVQTTGGSLFAIDGSSAVSMTAGESTLLTVDRVGDTLSQTAIDLVFNLGKTTSVSDITVSSGGQVLSLQHLQDSVYGIFVPFNPQTESLTFEIKSNAAVKTDAFFKVELKAVMPADQVDPSHSFVDETIIGSQAQGYIYSFDSSSTLVMASGMSTTLFIDRDGDTSQPSSVYITLDSNNVTLYKNGALLTPEVNTTKYLVSFGSGSTQEEFNVQSKSGINVTETFHVGLETIAAIDHLDPNYRPLVETINPATGAAGISITSLQQHYDMGATSMEMQFTVSRTDSMYAEKVHAEMVHLGEQGYIDVKNLNTPIGQQPTTQGDIEFKAGESSFTFSIFLNTTPFLMSTEKIEIRLSKIPETISAIAKAQEINEIYQDPNRPATLAIDIDTNQQGGNSGNHPQEIHQGSSTLLTLVRSGDISGAPPSAVLTFSSADIQVLQVTPNGVTPLTLTSSGANDYYVTASFFAQDPYQAVLSINSVAAVTGDWPFEMTIDAPNNAGYRIDLQHDTMTKTIVNKMNDFNNGGIHDGSLVISEIMLQNEAVEREFNNEKFIFNNNNNKWIPVDNWIEIYNTTGETIDLQGLQLHVGAQEFTISNIAQNTLLKAGGYLLLSTQGGDLTDQNGNIIQNIYVGPSFKVDENSGTVAILNANTNASGMPNIINQVDLKDPAMQSLISQTLHNHATESTLELQPAAYSHFGGGNPVASTWQVSSESYYSNGPLALNGSIGHGAFATMADSLNVDDLKITKYMAEPISDPTHQQYSPQWFEIYNATDKVVDLKGLTFVSNEGSFTVLHDVYVQAHHHFALGQGFINFPVGSPYSISYDYNGSSFHLESNDTISIIDWQTAQHTINSVTYTGATPGHSTELNLDNGQWSESQAPAYDALGNHGTPGFNSVVSISIVSSDVNNPAKLTMHDGASAMLTVARTGDLSYSSSVDVNFYVGAQLPLDDVKAFVQGDSMPLTLTWNGNGGYSATLDFAAGDTQKELSVHSIAAVANDQTFKVKITSLDKVDQNHQSITGIITDSARAFNRVNGDLVPGALAITEIMPGSNAFFKGGWIEVHNTTHQDITLAGMHLVVGVNDFIIDGSTQNTNLQAGDYAVIASDSGDIRSLEKITDSKGDSIQIIEVQKMVVNPSQDIRINDDSANEIDHVNAFNTLFLQQLLAQDNHSAELTPDVFNGGAIVANNDTVTSWAVATTPTSNAQVFGSPGEGLQATLADSLIGGELKITEYMADPHYQQPEWFEIQNTTNKTIDLKGLTFMSQEGSFTILEDTYVEAQQYLALSSSSLNNIKNNYVYDASGFHLGNDDTLSILNLHAASAKEIDTVLHTTSTPGHSTYWDGASWQLSNTPTPVYTLDNYGTPGMHNVDNHS